MRRFALLIFFLGLLAQPAQGQAPSPEELAEIEQRLHIGASQGSVRALLGLAHLYSGQGRFSDALQAIARAEAVAPNSEEVLGLKAQISLALGTPVPAIRALEPLTRMHPTVAQYSYLLGVALIQVSETADAVITLRETIELAPDNALAYTALGLALNMRKHFAEAIEVLTESLRLDPEHLETLAALAEAQEGIGELEIAEQFAQRVLHRTPQHAKANQVIGSVRMKEARYQEARKALERALESDPKLAKAHYQLSLACARLGDQESSQRHHQLYREALAEIDAKIRSLREMPPEPKAP